MIKKYLLRIARLSLMFSLSLGTQSSLLASAAPDAPASKVVTKEHTHIFLMLDQVYGLLASSTGPLEVLRQQLAASTNALVPLLHASEIILLDAKRQKQVTETIAILSNYNGLYHKPEQASVEMNAQFKAFAALLLSKTAPILPTACTFCFKDFTHGQKLLSLKCVCQTCSLKGDINVFCETCPIIGQCPNYLESQKVVPLIFYSCSPDDIDTPTTTSVSPCAHAAHAGAGSGASASALTAPAACGKVTATSTSAHARQRPKNIKEAMTIVAFYRDNKLQLHHAMQPAIDELNTARINTQRHEALIKLVQKALNELGLFVSGLKIWLSPEQKETLQNIANHFESTGLNKKITKPIEMLLIKTAMAEADAAGY